MPIYRYEILGSDGLPTGEVFEEFQSMRDDALERHPKTGQPCRRAIVASATIRMAKPKPRRARITQHKGEGVFNAAKRDNPFVSDSLAQDDRDGVTETWNGITVRKHADGTMSTYLPHDPSNDKRPIVPDEKHRAKWCQRQGFVHRKE
jgi:hypothetical protein